MPDDTYLDPYRRSAQRHGSDFGVTLWASVASQQRRFEVFTQMCDFTARRVLDAGCSRGDLAAFLDQRHVAYEQFVGIDALPQVIEFASARRLPRTLFQAGDFIHHPHLLRTGSPHVICLSGTLNTMADDQVLALLEHAWAATSHVLLFNFLSDRCGRHAPKQDSFARRLDTMALLDWAFACTWCVSFRQDYFEHGHDATIMMTRPPT